MTTKETTQTIEEVANIVMVDLAGDRVIFSFALSLDDWVILQRPERGVATVVFDLEVPPLPYIEDPI